MRRVLFSALFVLASLDAQAAVCAGRDLLADLKANNPAAYAEVEAKARATPNAEGLLWRIEGAAKPSYLFGTIHLSDPRVVTLAPEVREAVAASDKLAVEIADLSRDEISATIVKHALVQKGGTLDNLPPEILPPLKAALKSRGIPSEAIGHFEQWFLVLALALPPCAFREMVAQNAEDVLDASLVKAARGAGKPVLGLETSEEQIAIFKALDADLIREGLILSPRFEPMAEDLLETLTQAYLDRRIAFIEHALQPIAGLSDKEAADTAYFQRALVDARNVNMLERSRADLKAGGLFIAVGAGHLPGPNGLVELLRKAGFTVTRVW